MDPDFDLIPAAPELLTPAELRKYMRLRADALWRRLEREAQTEEQLLAWADLRGGATGAVAGEAEFRNSLPNSGTTRKALQSRW